MSSDLVKRIRAYSYADADKVEQLERALAEAKRYAQIFVDEWARIARKHGEYGSAPQPEALPPIPASIVRRIIRECEDAEHPKGMSTHDGRTRLHSSDVRMLMKRLELAEGRQYMNNGRDT